MEPDFLSKMERKLPFDVPEGYFGKLNEEIMGRAGREGEQAAIPEAAAGNIFVVPNGYFSQLPGRLFSRISQSWNTKPATGNLTSLIYVARTAAAACVALLLGILGVMQVEKQHTDSDSLVNIVNFDEDMLVQEYLETYSPATAKQSPDIETYILNHVDESVILQEL